MSKLSTILIFVLFLLAACTPAASTPSTVTNTAPSPTEPQPTAAVEVTVGAVLRTFSNTYWVSIKEGIEDRARELGITTSVQAGAVEGDPESQQARLETMINEGYDCYIVAPVSTENLIPPLVTASEQGKPIVNQDVEINKEAAEAVGVKIATHIVSDNVEAGRIAANYFNEKLGGQGKVAVIEGNPASTGSQLRVQGFVEGLDPGITIVNQVAADWDREKALTAAESILLADPDLNGFFSANDTMALGVAQAVKNAGKTGQVMVIGVDGIEAALEAIGNGDLTGTVSQYPYIAGRMDLESCVAAINGVELQPTYNSPIALITSENLEQALSAFPNPFFDFKDPIADLVK
jgi:ribose transport system substrate-binding protein